MAWVTVERLAHGGLRAEVINARGLLDLRAARVGPDRQEEMTPGAAVAGMRRTGWGCAKRPLSVTPPWCANTPLDLVCRAGVGAEMGTRCQHGRPLAEVSASGGELWCRERARAGCAPAGRDGRCTHLDPTRVSLSGEDVPDRDEPTMLLTHRDSNDHRPDLPHAVVALMVSHEGGPVEAQGGRATPPSARWSRRGRRR
jgi:Domain of unknown function (DUF4277)